MPGVTRCLARTTDIRSVAVGGFDNWAAEHMAVRQDVGLFDKSFMGKFLVQGRDALAVLNHVIQSATNHAVGEKMSALSERIGALTSTISSVFGDPGESLVVLRLLVKFM